MRRWIGAALVLAACGGEATPADGGPMRDGGGRDGGVLDDASMATDGGTLSDGGRTDGGPGDGGGTTDDAGPRDGGSTTPAADPSRPGPFTVDDSRTAIVMRGARRVPVAAYVPSGSERAPLVLFLPGFQVEASQYSILCERVASHGFVVVAADPQVDGGFLPNPSHVEMTADARAAIDWAIADATLAPRIDASRVAVMGHSLGGKLAFMLADADRRIGAVLGLDPINGAGGPGSPYSAARPDIVPELVQRLTIPIGLPGETFSSMTSGGIFDMPCAPADQNYLTFFDAATASPWVVRWTLEGADHMDFVDNRAACGTACGLCAMGPGDSAAVRDTAATLAAAFFLRHQRGVTAMDAWLTGASVPALARDLAQRP